MKTFSPRAWSARTAIVLLGLFIFTSCGRDGVAPTAPGSPNFNWRDGTGSIHAAVLKVSDESVRFEDVEDEVDVSPVYVSVTSKNSDVVLTGLTVTASSSPAGWLHASLEATTSPTRVRISVTSEDLEYGNYTGSVVVTAPGAWKSPAEIKVHIDIDKAHRKLVVVNAPAGAVVGAAFTTQPVIEIRRIPSNKLAKDIDKVTAQLEGSSVVLGGITTVKAVNGVATFTNLQVPTAGAYTLLFTSEDDVSARAPLVVTPVPPPTFLLAVNKVGSGTVTSTNLPGINCGASCSATYSLGDQVILSAIPDAGSVFSSWSGGSCTGGSVCTVNVNGPKTETANFVQLVLTSVVVTGAPGALTVGGTAQLTASTVDQFGNPIAATVTWASSSGAASVSGNGLVTAVSAGTASITATATAGTATASGATPPITINPVVPAGNTLNINVTNGGSVNASTSANPAGFDCTDTCSFTYDPGTVVTLTFAFDGDYNTFAWGGACSGSTFTCTVTMDSNKSVSTVLAHENLVSSASVSPAIRVVSIAVAER